MDSQFDSEKFIIEIENRPAIWNSACSEYSNRHVKKKCWEELTDIFSNEYNTVQEKKEIGINLQRKWKSLRDCFSRELSRIKKLKSGSETSRKNPYVYYNQLLFLKPIIQNKPTETNIIPNADESGDDLGSSFNTNVLNNEPSSKKKKVNQRNSVENEIINALHQSVELRKEQTKNYEEDADRLFLLSLLKPLKEIPEHLRFSVKMNLMKVINNAQINSASLTMSHHPQQYNLSSQNVMSPYTSYHPAYQTTQLHPDTYHQSVLQNQFNSQVRPTSATQHQSSTSTPLPSPSYASTENSTDSYIETDIFN